MCNASWDWTFPEVERSYQIWQPFQKRQFVQFSFYLLSSLTLYKKKKKTFTMIIKFINMLSMRDVDAIKNA